MTGRMTRSVRGSDPLTMTQFDFVLFDLVEERGETTQ